MYLEELYGCKLYILSLVLHAWLHIGAYLLQPLHGTLTARHATAHTRQDIRGVVFKNTGVCGSSQRFEVLSDPNTRGVPILYWGRGVSVGLVAAALRADVHRDLPAVP